jgi:hypothetical protein
MSPFRREDDSVLSVVRFHSEGPSFNLTGDRDRQRFLALVSMLTAMCGVFGNGIKEGRFGKSVGQSILSFFFNWGVQVEFSAQRTI